MLNRTFLLKMQKMLKSSNLKSDHHQIQTFLSVHPRRRINRNNSSNNLGNLAQYSTLTSSAIDLNYSDQTAGKHYSKGVAPLVILHGLLGSYTNFRTVTRFPLITSNRPVILADLRNHGSSPHVEEMSFKSMAADVVRLLDRLEVSDCMLLGHSLGGKVAMTAALLHPTRIARLVIADIAPVEYPHSNAQWSSVKNVIAALSAIDMTKVHNRESADLLLSEAIEDRGLRQFVLQNLAPPSSMEPRWHWRCNLEAILRSFPSFSSFPFSDAPPFTKPALFIAGGLSSYLTSEHHAIIQRQFTRATFEVVPNAGHWLHAENPEGFYNRVAHFLR